MIDVLARKRSLLLLFVAALGALALVWGCSGTEQNPVAPSNELTLDASNPQIQSVMAIQDRHTWELMAMQDVIGTATTVDEDGHPAIMLLVTAPATASAMRATPMQLEGIRVVIVETDKIVAMKGGGGVSHKAKQTPPFSWAPPAVGGTIWPTASAAAAHWARSFRWEGSSASSATTTCSKPTS